MKLSLLIPTKDGGEGYDHLIRCIYEGLSFANNKIGNLDSSVTFLVNGDPTIPLSFLDLIDKRQYPHNTVTCEQPGKVRAIKKGIEAIKADIYITLDDDIEFDKENIFLAIKDLTEDQDLQLVSFQQKIRPYQGNNPIKRFFYDIINIRSLNNLYINQDPFLFGRFLAFKKNAFNVPENIMLEDLYLSIYLDGKYKIRPEFIQYSGLDSITKHFKRVRMLETGRSQIRHIFGTVYNNVMKNNKRTIDSNKVKKLSFYNKVCFYMYKALRFLTNNIYSKVVVQKTIYW